MRSSVIRSVSVILAIVAFHPVWPASVSQRTEGPCSPTVADVKGNVSIVCNGIDSSKADEIIRLLNEILQDAKKWEQFKQELDETSKRTDEIEARQAWRRLNQSQSTKLTALLGGKFRGTRIGLRTIANNSEAIQFAIDIAHALRAAGWNVIGISHVTVIGLPPTGLRISIDGDTPSAPMRALIDSFRSIGYEITVRNRKKPRDPPNEVIELFIGNKPI